MRYQVEFFDKEEYLRAFDAGAVVNCMAYSVLFKNLKAALREVDKLRRYNRFPAQITVYDIDESGELDFIRTLTPEGAETGH
jgi:hypothetical protein